MPHIDWVIVADLAFLDRQMRPCMVGVRTRLVVPALPVVLRQLMMVVHVIEPAPGEAMDLGVVVSTPTGRLAMPDGPGNVLMEMAEEHVLVTLRDLPLTEKGHNRSAAYLGEYGVVFDVPVFVVPTELRSMEAH